MRHPFRPRTRAAGIALAACLAIVLAYVGICAALWARQQALVFVPDPVVRRTPGDLGIPYVERSIPVGTHGVVAAWWLPSTRAAADNVALLYLHGNDGNLGQEVERLAALRDPGLPILAIDYRGYGRSSGPPPSEAQVYADAAAAVEYLQRGAEGTGAIIVYGHSLGSAVAAELALRRLPICALVLEGAFTSMADMARAEYPWIPIDVLLHQRFDTRAKLSRIDVPIAFVHGGADEIVPRTMMDRLYAAARGSKRAIVVPGANHEHALPNGRVRIAAAIAELAGGCAGRRSDQSSDTSSLRRLGGMNDSRK